MNCELKELSDGMFYYLTSMEDKPVSIYMMWNQMTSKQGYHCSDLTIEHKQKLITEFHCLPNTYKKVLKFYRNGTPHLVYTKLESWEFDQDKYVPKEESTNVASKLITLEDLMETYLDNNLHMIDLDFIKWLVNNDQTKYVRKILDNYTFAKEEYNAMLKEANKNTEIVAMILKSKYKQKIYNLKNNNNILKNKNNSLEEVNNRLGKNNSSLAEKVSSLQTSFILSIPVWYMITYYIGPFMVC
jgi:hypothetical protein